jgi:hypothetical protein
VANDARLVRFLSSSVSLVYQLALGSEGATVV